MHSQEDICRLDDIFRSDRSHGRVGARLGEAQSDLAPSVIPTSLPQKYLRNRQPNAYAVALRSIQRTAEALHGGVPIPEGQQGVPGRHQDVHLAVAILLGHLDITKRLFPIPLPGMDLRSHSVDCWIRRGQLGRHVERPCRLRIATHVVQSVGKSQLRREVVRFLLQRCPVLGLGVSKVLFLTKSLGSC